MPSKWGTLSKDANLLQRFEADLREFLAKDYEVDDELVKFVISSVKEVENKKQLAAEFNETFDDDAADVATWCWDKLAELSAQPSAGHAETTEAGLLDELSEEGELAAEQPESRRQEEQQISKKSKREPIKFNLEVTAADTAPIKASLHKSQQMQPHRAAVIASPAESQQQPKQQESGDSFPKPDVSKGAAAAVKGALAAAVRSTAADGRGSRDHPADTALITRGRGRHREQAPPDEKAGAAAAAPPLRSQAAHGLNVQPRESSRAAASHREPPARVAGAKRSLVDSAAAASGPRNLVNRAFLAITGGSRDERASKRQQQQRQQQQDQEAAGQQHQLMEHKQRVQKEPQQQRHIEQQQQQQQEEDEQDEQRQQQQQYNEKRKGRVSVLDRLGSKDSQGDAQQGNSKHSVFERLSGLAPGTLEAQVAAGGAEAMAAEEPAVGKPRPDAAAAATEQPTQQSQQQQQQPRQQQQQQQQQQPGVAGVAHGDGPRRSVVHRLEGAGSGAADQQQHLDQQQQRLSKQPASTYTAAAAAQQATAEAAAQGQVEPAAAPGTKRKASVSASANGQEAARAKKLATASASGAKPQPSSELAALRAKLAAKEAEVKRLQQLKALQEADERSVVVYNVAPLAPEAVVRAHFGGCGPIRRCTLLPGRLPGPNTPGAYLEFESNTGALAAMGLAGSYMLNQQIQVARKSDYKANQQKAKQSYAALRAQAGAVIGKHWSKPVAAPNTAAASNTAAVSTGAVGGGEPESPTSLGSMGLIE